uniref:Uncharacterized protein n=1 Tax=Oryza sativa subsp. japonica TaxID=39947 RepID=Q6K5R2_ORYSJ|nr:hypothetical protein [Oryza sativa Japonica Group]
MERGSNQQWERTACDGEKYYRLERAPLPPAFSPSLVTMERWGIGGATGVRGPVVHCGSSQPTTFLFGGWSSSVMRCCRFPSPRRPPPTWGELVMRGQDGVGEGGRSKLVAENF